MMAGLSAAELPLHADEPTSCALPEHAPLAELRRRIHAIDRFSSGPCSPLIEKRVPEMARLLEKYDEISSNGVPYCGGTLYRDIGAALQALSLRAAVDPEPDPEDVDSKISSQQLTLPANMSLWAQQGRREQREYAEILRLRNAALPALRAYYMQKFALSEAQAQRTATFYLNLFAKEYLGRASESEGYESLGLRAADVRAFLQLPAAERSKRPSEQLEALLNLAIINGFSRDEVAAVLAAVPPGTVFPVKNRYRETPLMKAADRTDVSEMLLHSGTSPIHAGNWFGKTALMYAAQAGNRAGVALLLKNGADPRQVTFSSEKIDKEHYCEEGHPQQRTALMYVQAKNRSDIAELLQQATHGL